MLRDYSFYGSRLRSRLPLPGLRGCDADGSDPDVTLTLGEVPVVLPDPVWSSPFVSISAEGTALIKVDSVGRFLLERGRAITLQRAPGATSIEIGAFLVGPVAGVLLHQQGVLPLHASCVRIGGGAVALAGNVGRGKSTIAAALVRRGAVLMSDDICPLIFPEDSAPVAMAGSTGLRLWPDSRRLFQGDAEGWLPVRRGHAKQVAVAGFSPGTGQCRLRAVIRLVIDRSGQTAIHRIHGPLSVTPMSSLVYRLRLGCALGRTKALFADIMRVADQVPVFEMCRPDGIGHLDETVDSVLAAIEASP